MSTNNNDIIVGFPLYNDVTLLDFAGATQVFAFSGGFKPIWLAKTLDPVMTSEGVTVNPGYTFGNHPSIDLLFVPGGGGNGVAHAMQDKTIQGFIKNASKTAEWSGSVCSGAFIIATTGLLDHCKATTYWSVLNILDEFPGIKVNTKDYPRFILQKKNKRFSGGGVSSSIDLALQLVKMIKGKRASQMADLSIQYAPEPPVHTGDPKQANNPALVAKVHKNQETGFIKLIADATNRVISKSC